MYTLMRGGLKELAMDHAGLQVERVLAATGLRRVCAAGAQVKYTVEA